MADQRRACNNVWKKLLDDDLGHDYVTFPDAGMMLVGCSLCASFVQTGPKHTHLMKECPKQPASTQAADRWDKMCKTGRHFRTHAVIGEPAPWSKALKQAEDQAQYWEDEQVAAI